MKSKILALAVAVTLAVAGNSFADSTILVTQHNLMMRNSNLTQPCAFCHTPHNASKASKAPLWNRTLPNGALFTLYSSNTAKNRLYKSGFTASSASLGCMSCHDGGTIGGRIINAPAEVPEGTPITADVIGVGKKNFGYDLTNHHPVNFNIDDTANAGIVSKFGITTEGLTLYKTGRPITGGGDNGTGIECSTCHNSHDNSFGKFLRKSNAGSSLCLTCHIK